jgi:S-adenosylmethionine hydrolase
MGELVLMIVLFTDFGANGPYLGQMEMAIRGIAPTVPVINLVSDAPCFDPRASAYLLAALVETCAPGAVILAVVDPGVGGDRRPLAVQVDGRWLIGPDNGLFELLIRRGTEVEVWEIVWRPERLSASFHGRDLFAPVAARLAMGQGPKAVGLSPLRPLRHPLWPDDLPSIIYTDCYGNAWTGLRASCVPTPRITVEGQVFTRADTFSDVPAGTAFWYENSSGLVEIAVNGGRADRLPGMGLGSFITI